MQSKRRILWEVLVAADAAGMVQLGRLRMEFLCPAARHLWIFLGLVHALAHQMSGGRVAGPAVQSSADRALPQLALHLKDRAVQPSSA